MTESNPIKNTVVLICGGRDWNRQQVTNEALDELDEQMDISLVIHGAAKGADTLASSWAKQRDIPVRAYPAQWRLHGRSAGFIRNQQMLEEGKPGLVIALPGGPGTAHMRRTAQEAGVRVIDLDHLRNTPDPA